MRLHTLIITPFCGAPRQHRSVGVDFERGTEIKEMEKVTITEFSLASISVPDRCCTCAPLSREHEIDDDLTN